MQDIWTVQSFTAKLIPYHKIPGNRVVTLSTCKLNTDYLQEFCANVECVVPENIYTSPMEEIFFPDPSPTLLKIQIKLHTFL